MDNGTLKYHWTWQKNNSRNYNEHKSRIRFQGLLKYLDISHSMNNEKVVLCSQITKYVHDDVTAFTRILRTYL